MSAIVACFRQGLMQDQAHPPQKIFFVVQQRRNDSRSLRIE
jgi:hypothetical protein